jgi:hypothetical protein
VTSGTTVTIQWGAVPGTLEYVLEAGSAPRLSDVVRLTTTNTSLVAPGVPFGTY